MKIVLVIIIVLSVVVFFIHSVIAQITESAQISEYPQVTQQSCDAQNICPEGLECFGFPGMGLRCAEPNPCGYYKCPDGTQCGVLEIHPVLVICSCASSGCPSPSSQKGTVSHELPSVQIEKAGTANPASVYCRDLGYKLKDSMCIFPDGSMCAEWSFYRGKCGQEFSFCEQKGFKIENRTKDTGTWTAEYAVCVFDDGSECLEEDYFKGRCSSPE